MKTSTKVLLLSAAGTLFAGYIGGVKFFTGHCTLGSECPLFLNYPTCYYGFIFFFLLLLLTTGYKVTKNIIHIKLIEFIAYIALIFSTYFSVIEIVAIFTKGAHYSLILPSCTYGLILYAIILYYTYDKSTTLL